MTPDEKRSLIVYRIAKSEETLREVDVLIANNLWNISVNRLYYACYYAVSALLLQDEIKSRTHSGTKQMFGLHFVMTGKIASEWGGFYSSIFELRQDGDYEDYIDFGATDVLALVEPAKNFVSAIKNLLLIE